MFCLRSTVNPSLGKADLRGTVAQNSSAWSILIRLYLLIVVSGFIVQLTLWEGYILQRVRTLFQEIPDRSSIVRDTERLKSKWNSGYY